MRNAIVGKTLRYRLSAAELDAVVRLMKRDDYGLLPVRLQMSLLSNRNMTAALGGLFLDPGKTVLGDGAEAENLRRKAAKVGQEDLADFVAEAVRRGWSHVEAKDRFLRMLKGPARCQGSGGDAPPARALLGRLHTMNEELQARLHDLATLSEAKPADIEKLRTVLSQLARQAEFLAGSLTEQQLEFSAVAAADSGKEGV